ncbi:hypothetical protein AYO38_10125 [bacterium SCGC AG-212-C10]|nr:hypothetical protein AYO38_10125 [bacterium SCGC AG-212-C10]
MLSYIAYKLSGSLFVIATVVVVTFFVSRSVGDPVRQMLPPFAEKEQFDQLRHNLELDRPALTQFKDFLGGAIRGDLGDSLWQNRSVTTIIRERIPATLLLGVTSLVLSFVIAIPLGVASAVWRGSWLDRGAMVMSIGSISMPSFWLGIMLILVFAVWLDLLPTSGSGSWKHVIMPAITVAALPTGRITQMVRSAMMDILIQQYVVTARSKGLTERVVVMRHAFRNAAIPVVTVAGWEVARVLAGGVVIVETVFAWPGIGLLTIQALREYDFPLVQATIMLQAAVIVVVNLGIDLSYLVVDPRLRRGHAS